MAESIEASSFQSNQALTEYSAQPSPPLERPGENTALPHWNLPQALLLPNGTPDVRFVLWWLLFLVMSLTCL